ncbi:zinc finger protein 281 [Folsomia candida]|uniref:zinc finger protein 281 n=1 Tax=Folsomia candida TaxID=158441 RepID=UPI000B8FB426|nr:zinc finger protein 281 [Folsomia candida]
MVIMVPTRQNSVILALPVDSYRIEFNPKTGKEMLICMHDSCRYRTDKNSNFKRHLATMHQLLEAARTCCEERFLTKFNLTHHNKTVHKNGYKCTTCSKEFTRNALLLRHQLTHSGKKPWGCTLCIYRSISKGNVQRHGEKVHNMLIKPQEMVHATSTLHPLLSVASGSSSRSIVTPEPEEVVVPSSSRHFLSVASGSSGNEPPKPQVVVNSPKDDSSPLPPLISHSIDSMLHKPPEIVLPSPANNEDTINVSNSTRHSPPVWKREGLGSNFFSCSSWVLSQKQQQQQGLNGMGMVMTGHQQCLDLRLPREETRRIFKSDGQVPGYFLHGFFLNGPPPPRFVEEVTTNKKVLKRGNNSCDKEKVHYLPKKLRVSKQYKDCM